MLVLATLIAPATRVISSLVGTTAMVPFWLTRALSSLRACEPDMPAGSVVSGALNAVQPFAGSRNAASSLSSLPLTMGVEPAKAAALAAVVGAAGVAAGVVPCVITSGLYTWTEPFGARMVASTNACSAELAIEQPSPSTHGVARPCADSGLAGAVIVQVPDAAAWSAFWFRLSALPAPSTGAL